MSKKTRISRPGARLPKGMRDVGARELRAMRWMLERIRETFESYGFEPLATPAFEYTDALGKYLPDQDRPGEGVFSLQDDDEQWLSLRYDLTAPLARYVAQNFDALPKPFRRYQWGPVWRNEKPGPGRYREFVQFDADTVGTASVAADAEMCMLAADCLEALGIERGQYVIKVSNRKVLDGVLESVGVDPHDTDHLGKRLTILRAIDKLDRLGPDAVRQLLGKGRKDESGDFTKGAGLKADQVSELMEFINQAARSVELMRRTIAAGDFFNNEVDQSYFLLKSKGSYYESNLCVEGHNELEEIRGLVRTASYGMDRIQFDPSVVRGLDYYTGPVYEAELTFEAENEEGQVARFGSVGGGGRYDHLIERFKGIEVPATGFSVGVSRLYAALEHLGRFGEAAGTGPVVVLVMERERLSDYLRLADELRQAGLRAEAYLGTAGMKAQMKYADRRGAPCVVIVGEDERKQDTVTIKDLIEGARLAAGIEGRAQWREERPAQVSVPRGRMVEAVREILARYGA